MSQISKTNGKNGKTTSTSKEVLDKREIIMEAVHTILDTVGEDPNRDGLLDTPKRVAKAYEELLAGYSQNLHEVVNDALFDVEYEDEMVIVEDIPYDSMCEHHMLPFSGKAHVAYIPSDKVIGLSKIPRIVDMFARRLQVQERMGVQIADAINKVLKPKGVIVMVEGGHSCAAMRGVKKKNVNMKTITTLGEFKHHRELRKEFLDLISL